MPTPKTTVAIVLKSGASVAVKTHWSQQEVEKAYENAWDSNGFLRIETSALMLTLYIFSQLRLQ